MRQLCFVIALVLPVVAEAQVNGEILLDDRDANGYGVTVLRLHGNDSEMGYAHGVLLADRIEMGLGEVRSGLGIPTYTYLRSVAAGTDWLDPDLEDEMAGIVAGVLAELPSAGIDVTDLQVINGMGDWAYLCRSHASWGSRNAAPGSTLMTRRLDYGTGFAIEHDHVIFAYAPNDGGPSYVNFAWPGFVTVATGVNENGVLVSLHDFNSRSGLPVAGATSRAAIAHYGLVTDWPGEVSTHATSFFDALAGIDPLTGTFINFYAPQGASAVLTCGRETGCGTLRLPQASYYGGEVIMTTNADTDGTYTPADDTSMAAFYDDPAAKTRIAHFDLMGDNGLHLVTVDHRDTGAITIRFKGEQPVGSTEPLELTWEELFSPPTCGNLVIETGELCDGAALAGNDCTTVPGDYVDGVLACLATCDAWDLSDCHAGGDVGGAGGDGGGGGTAGSGGTGGNDGEPEGGCAATGGSALAGGLSLLVAWRRRGQRRSRTVSSSRA